MTARLIGDNVKFMEREERWIIPATILAISSIVWAAAFAAITGYRDRPSGTNSLIASLAIISLAASWRFARFLHGLWTAGDAHPIAQIRMHFRPAAIEFLPIITGIGIIAAFLSSQTFLKSMIVAMVPFWADGPLAAFDQLLHLDPARLAAGMQQLMKPLGGFYALWQVINLGGILWVLHWKGYEKGRLIIGYMLTWAIGMMLAYVFSSAGPIFTGRYSPNLAPHSVQLAVKFLWTNYKESGAALGGGISAFPSMHVAIAAWFALVLRERGLGWLGAVYTLCIFAGSIVLGWHYLLDGVAGIAVALFANHLASLWMARRKPFASPAIALAAVSN
jgi:membrane-associated phospholipid phosphatase